REPAPDETDLRAAASIAPVVLARADPERGGAAPRRAGHEERRRSDFGGADHEERGRSDFGGAVGVRVRGEDAVDLDPCAVRDAGQAVAANGSGGEGAEKCAGK